MANYNQFIFSCLSLTIYELVILIDNVLIYIVFEKKELEVLAVFTIVTAIYLGVFLLVIQLLFFHLWLKIKGWSTFSYLNYNRLLSSTKEHIIYYWFTFYFKVMCIVDMTFIIASMIAVSTSNHIICNSKVLVSIRVTGYKNNINYF